MPRRAGLAAATIVSELQKWTHPPSTTGLRAACAGLSREARAPHGAPHVASAARCSITSSRDERLCRKSTSRDLQWKRDWRRALMKVRTTPTVYLTFLPPRSCSAKGDCINFEALTSLGRVEDIERQRGAAPL